LNDIFLHDNNKSSQQRQKLFAHDNQELVNANNEAFGALNFQSDDSDPDTIIWHQLTDIPPNLSMFDYIPLPVQISQTKTMMVK